MRKKKSQPPKFKGELNEPILRTNQLALAILNRGKSDAERKRILKDEADRLFNQQINKLVLLFEHYKIEPFTPNPSLRLAYHLASDFVPGMRIENAPVRKRGRPKKWKGSDGVQLVTAVQEIVSRRKKGIADAVRIARKRYPDWDRYSSTTLVSRYYESLKEIERRKALLEMATQLGKIASAE